MRTLRRGRSFGLNLCRCTSNKTRGGPDGTPRFVSLPSPRSNPSRANTWQTAAARLSASQHKCECECVCVCVCVVLAHGARRTAYGPRPTAHSARPTAHGAWSTAGARENRRRMSLWQIGSQTTESGAGEQFLLKGGKAVSRVRGIVLFKPVPAARPLLLRQRQDRPQRWYGHFSCWNCFCP